METLNISSGSDDLRERELSNLTIRSFILDDVRLRSVEGFVQGVKYPPGDPRREETFGMAGLRAKHMSEYAENKWVWWNDVQYVYGSSDNHTLIERAIRASFEQNPIAMFILRSTRGMILTHDLGAPESPRTSFPAREFCRVMTELRDEGDARLDRYRADKLGLIPRLSLADAQAAAKMIEIDGIEAFQTACRYGFDAAYLLLVAHLRRALGSTASYPPDPGIDAQVKQMLIRHGIEPE